MVLRRHRDRPADHPDRGGHPERAAGPAAGGGPAGRLAPVSRSGVDRGRRAPVGDARRRRVAARIRRAADRPRCPPRPRLRPARPLRRPRLRPPLHGPGLPARDARGGRDPARGLRPRAVAALVARLGSLARDRRRRRRVRPGRRDGVDLRASGSGPVPPAPLLPRLTRRARARLRRCDRRLRPRASRVGLRALEEPRRLRAPGRRRPTTGAATARTTCPWTRS